MYAWRAHARVCAIVRGSVLTGQDLAWKEDLIGVILVAPLSLTFISLLVTNWITEITFLADGVLGVCVRILLQNYYYHSFIGSCRSKHHLET